MAHDNPTDRRRFIKLCMGAGALVATNPALLARPAGRLNPTDPVRLVDTAGKPIHAGSLSVGENYVFHYPFVTTPCFLIDLGAAAPPGDELVTADGQSYRWQGGAGPSGSVVAFSAICAHRMSYPTRAVSFISYRHSAPAGADSGHEQVIYCCSEGSMYDPRDGGRVLGGPAPQPLAAVGLSYDEQRDDFHVTGLYGGDMTQRFLSEFGFQIALDSQSDDIRRPASGDVAVMRLDDYSRTRVC